VEDVSEEEQLRQRLNLYEHLAIMGKLTLCVVHELNNPLDGINRYLSLALMKKDDPEAVERFLGEAQKGLQKMSLSIRSLIFSANPFKSPPRASDNLLNLLQDAVKIMMFQASDQRVKVDFHPPGEFHEVTVETDLYYVFINVIKNALQAMPHGGHLKVEGHLSDHQVEIVFTDSGPGLSAEELDKVFQPFYSTKEGVQGLGLGLPICQKILERYQGSLVVESQPGHGTKVILLFPWKEAGRQHGH
jgi:two-component system sporulation sensor kinase A